MLGARSSKRIADVLGSALGLLILSPVLLAAMAAVRIYMGGPVLFRQSRAGRHGRVFTFYKLRTMSDDRDRRGVLLPDEKRLTALGRWLRSTSLDELPQLWNVLNGDMSLVGPRPLLAAYLPRYNAFQRRRHEVRPGITGWTQVHGRNALSWERKFELDVWYVDRWSLWLDAKILALTARRIFQRDGISQPGHATMPEFLGSSERGESGDRLAV
jgi:lipopolysaccharide/colanic/teichoic acid biosynthesis glycosyltransferase